MKRLSLLLMAAVLVFALLAEADSKGKKQELVDNKKETLDEALATREQLQEVYNPFLNSQFRNEPRENQKAIAYGLEASARELCSSDTRASCVRPEYPDFVCALYGNATSPPENAEGESALSKNSAE